MSQYNFNNSTNCHTTNSYNTTSSYNTTNNVWKNCTVADDRSQLMAWLSPLDAGLRHCDIQERRVNDVGEWLMGTQEFRRWCGFGGEGRGNEGVLFCYGNPGVGKTFVCSLVVDWLCEWTRGQHTVVACFYSDFAARKEQTVTCMLGSLIKQMINRTEGTSAKIWRALREQKDAVSGRRPQLSDIVKMLQLITSSQPTFMVIDALDECTAAQRYRLLDSLKEILEKSPDARIFVTGRPHVRAEIETRLAGRVTSVSISPIRSDIIRFLRARLGEDETPDAMDESLEADILEKIPGSISEMFLLASLNIDGILQESTVYRRRERLDKMTDGLGLGDIYDATIERIKAQGGDKSGLGMGALMWISHAERPLSPRELCHALAVEIGSTDFNSGNIPSVKTLIGCCQGLITVDKGASTVRLVHFTLKEYLSTHPDIFSSPHSTIAEICLTYLNSQRVKALSTESLVDPRQFDLGDFDPYDFDPFLLYCSLYWGVHAKKELSDYGRSLAMELLQEYDYHISAIYLIWDIGYPNLQANFTSFPLGGLHCASFFGIVEVATALIEVQGYGTSERYCLGDSPLAWAARNGHEEVVKMLVGREEVDPEEPNDYGQTPLFYAARKGNEEVLKLLLGREEVNPDRPDNDGRTPLSYAASEGCERVVKILLGQEQVDPDRPDNGGRTPLSYAAQKIRGGAVKMLLGREEVNPDLPDNWGRTPLSYAAQEGCGEAVELLLGREEVNPDCPDNDGRTPISYAAAGKFTCDAKAYAGVVKMLLERVEVNPEKPNNGGRTPLSYAARGGCRQVAKMLLQREEINPDYLDNCGRAPLSYAAESGFMSDIKGSAEVMKILLERAEVNPEKPDTGGRTPLSYAAQAGRDEAVEMLLGREEVNPDCSDNDGRAPISYAAEGRFTLDAKAYAGVVKMLLGRVEVNPEKPDNGGRTPLSYASQTGHGEAVEILLGREEGNPDCPDNDGRTPFSYAAAGRFTWDAKTYAGVAKILLGREEVNPDLPDNNGRAPLSYAAQEGCGQVVTMLLGREEVNPEKPDIGGRTPLSHAAEGEFMSEILGFTGVVKMLLERVDVNPEKPDNRGRTPLSYATTRDEELVMLLKKYSTSTT